MHIENRSRLFKKPTQNGDPKEGYMTWKERRPHKWGKERVIEWDFLIAGNVCVHERETQRERGIRKSQPTKAAKQVREEKRGHRRRI